MAQDRFVELQELARSSHAGGAVETGAEFAHRHQLRTGSAYGPLSVHRELASLFPTGGLERGQIYGCRGDASLSLLCSLIGPPTQQGSWVAMVNMEFLGVMSAREHGVALHRFVYVNTGDRVEQWSKVVGACVDGIDIVVVHAPQCSLGDARRIEARMKASGSIVIVIGQPGVFSPSVVLTAHSTEWDFSSYAHSRTIRVVATGRRIHGQRTCDVVFPVASCL